MSRSKSPNAFYSTILAVLEAPTGDLRELAKITGVPAESLYVDANLAGVDLTGQDATFLYDITTDFEHARLLESQRRAFTAARRQRDRQARMVDERLKLVAGFVHHYASVSALVTKSDGSDPLLPDQLATIILNPVSNLGFQLDQSNVKRAYATSVLIGLAPYAHDRSLDFFTGLFATLGALGVEPSKRVIKELSESYLPGFGSTLGEFLSQLKANVDVDRWFIKQAGDSRQVMLFADCLSAKRPLHTDVVMEVLKSLKNLEDLITFLERSKASVSDDKAEEIAYMIGRFHWTRDQSKRVLSARLPRTVFMALTRQIMQHPDQNRLALLIIWRDADRGAAGALSLEDLFGAFTDFDVAIRAANEIAGNLRPNQIRVVIEVLSRLARGRSDLEKIERLRRSAGDTEFEAYARLVDAAPAAGEGDHKRPMTRNPKLRRLLY